ncbi:synaptotagmin-like protein 2 isoform X7 [Sphaerodactylus townsendi]|uniref:synaptotagmin-like protein 2 isoform X7 n=1 Tax=Sphaerodactylus townsendi TaxID=933632 RepID=UPI00202652B6|nr:synaptotagmin-like protein 2 isoform X7 [Sphaerodactylus townsendi]
MIDLSFLTDEEQEAILKVLQRDANLKRAEEERVRHLPEKVDDEIQIKNMSGQWFYEVKSKRHRDKIHGADIIRASMRRKPLTAELSQNKTGKKQKSWVNNVNKEVLTPPELFGAIEEAEGESKSSLSPTAFNADATPQEGTKKAAVSPSKERKNPFNNSNLLEENADRKGGISSSSETSKKDSLLPSVEYQPEVNIANGRLEKPELASVEPNDPNGQTGKPPIPRARKNIHKTSDVSVTSEDSFSKAPRRIQPGNGQGTPPRGILKRNSSTSSTDSEVLRLNQTGDPSYKNGLPASTILEGVVDKNSYPGRDPEGFSQNSLERAKQVRFSSSVSRKERPPSLDLHEGKESGEFGLLDSDCGKTGGDRARGSDSLQDEQTPPIKPLASTSMDLNGRTEDQATSREGNADLVSYNADGSGILQSQESSPAEFGASSDSPRETFPKVTKEPSRDEAKLEIKTGQRSPGPDAKPSSAGQPLPLANAEDPRAPSAVSADLEQGSAEDPNPVLEALKRSSNRQIPSKSLEDIPSATSNEGKVNTRKEDLMLSAEDDQKAIQRHEPHTTTPGISAAPSFPVNQFSNPEKVKRMSKSVPTFLQEESDGRETDTASENSYSLGKIKKSPSSLTNLSGSSGLASLSSVSTSVVSVYSGDFGNVDVKGNIQFAIDYVEQLKELHIFIAQCKDLAVADVKKQRSDPYVKCYLLPEKYKLGKRKTSVKKKTLNPVYNEILRYKVDKILLTSQRLNISVWHNDTFGRNSFLGEVDLDLGSWDWDDRQIKQMIWYPLKPRAPLASLELENRGEIKLSLQYIPQPDGGKKPSATGEVHIWVKECHDLPLLKGNKLNTFVKCTVLPDTSRKSRQKTRAVAKATNPVFNHTMVYDGFKFEDLKEACVELTVWDHKQLVNHFLGGLRIGLGTGKSYGTAVDWMDSTLEETSLWERMMNSPDQWVEGTLPLRMLTIAKMTK